ncbi:MAG: hypothetical protein MJ072_03325, partial [Clostridia bacterium]|nr:hypothetical protein [Clostridia bacterium]
MFLQYEWIKIAALAFVLCFLLSFVFSTLGSESTLLNVGQMYFVYYSYETVPQNSDNMQMFLETDGVFSYEVQKVVSVQLDRNYNRDQLTAWLATGRADAMICSTYKENADVKSELETYIDGYGGYDFDSLYLSAKEYAKKFQITEGEDFSVANVSREKTEDEFLARLSGDRRYKKGLISKDDEYDRICKLFNDISDFGVILSRSELFVSYRAEGDETEKRYAIDLGKLSGGRTATNLMSALERTYGTS